MVVQSSISELRILSTSYSYSLIRRSCLVAIMPRCSVLQSLTLLLLLAASVYVAHNVVEYLLGVDGGYTKWSSFNECSVTCGGGVRTRIRTCTNPRPRFGGRNCSIEPAIQVFKCNRLPCPVNGGYGKWEDYQKCSVSCGGGVQEKKRKCDKPAPQFGGKNCREMELGPDSESRKCNQQPCPVNGGYGKWEDYKKCSVSCGGGVQEKTRKCDKPAPQFGGKNCREMELGPDSESRKCNEQPCAVNGGYGKWEDYKKCSVSCGGGVQEKTRKCDKPAPQFGGKNCSEMELGPDSESRKCNEQPCAVNGGYSDWNEYTQCSATCGGGSKSRARKCTNPEPAHGGKNCEGLGPAEETAACNTEPCPTTPPPTTQEPSTLPTTQPPASGTAASETQTSKDN